MCTRLLLSSVDSMFQRAPEKKKWTPKLIAPSFFVIFYVNDINLIFAWSKMCKISFHKSKGSFKSVVKWPSYRCVTKIAVFGSSLAIIYLLRSVIQLRCWKLHRRSSFESPKELTHKNRSNQEITSQWGKEPSPEFPVVKAGARPFSSHKTHVTIIVYLPPIWINFNLWKLTICALSMLYVCIFFRWVRVWRRVFFWDTLYRQCKKAMF